MAYLIQSIRNSKLPNCQENYLPNSNFYSSEKFSRFSLQLAVKEKLIGILNSKFE